MDENEENVPKSTSQEVRIPVRRTNRALNSWKPGQSGNPAGKPVGTKNKLTLFREAVLAKQEKKLLTKYPQVLDVVIEKALRGDLIAARMVMDRIVPVKKAQEDKPEDQGKQAINIIIQGAKGVATMGHRTMVAEFEKDEVEDGEIYEVDEQGELTDGPTE